MRTLFIQLRRFVSTSAAASARATASTSDTSTSTSFYKVTLKRSTIGLASTYRAATRTLRLNRLHQTVYHPISPTAAGLILKLKELLKVEIVKRVPTREEERAERSPPKGYRVVKKGRQETLF
ncbi:hypothetical protein BC938DRAFT_471113 [Jimgerdemannia flammicorona]|uniref:Large ribosomal subunit protein uL30-like ferredoxin-like fold domain-containing protein n=1 Tax=Jimgerdemannia flammicorona TaxID=994334 RepID=A0A433QUS7_9FUNG|nr:hypothetical protein BC938DRAFT_471113 [Jimgerdemannia flammicorona]